MLLCAKVNLLFPQPRKGTFIMWTSVVYDLCQADISCVPLQNLSNHFALV